MPTLPRRLPLGDSRMPIWIRYTKKILVEEGHSIPSLTHIFQLIIRHSDIFYSCRAQFIPQMVNSLSRVGLPYNTTSKNRRLVIELSGLVVSFERQRQNENRMPNEFNKYMIKTYNEGHIALGLLECHVMLFVNDTKFSESWVEIYHLLNEEDMRCGLWKKRSITTETRVGLSLVQHGFWQRAQSLLYQAMVKAIKGTYNNAIPKDDMCLWEERWLNYAIHLSQWDVLLNFGKLVENYKILLDSLWK